MYAVHHAELGIVTVNASLQNRKISQQVVVSTDFPCSTTESGAKEARWSGDHAELPEYGSRMAAEPTGKTSSSSCRRGSAPESSPML